MAESDLNKRVCAALADFHPKRIENTIGEGTPDIAFTGGWIEDKQFDFPKRPETVVKCAHYTTHQRAWHTAHCRAGGVVLVAIEDSRTGRFYVVNGIEAASGFGFWTEAQLRKRSLLFQERFDAIAFRKFVINWCAGAGRNLLA